MDLKLFGKEIYRYEYDKHLDNINNQFKYISDVTIRKNNIHSMYIYNNNLILNFRLLLNNDLESYHRFIFCAETGVLFMEVVDITFDKSYIKFRRFIGKAILDVVSNKLHCIDSDGNIKHRKYIHPLFFRPLSDEKIYTILLEPYFDE
jgi:hypothetical protein